MNAFLVTVRTAACRITYTALAPSSLDAAMDAVELVGMPCGVTVTRPAAA